MSMPRAANWRRMSAWPPVGLASRHAHTASCRSVGPAGSAFGVAFGSAFGDGYEDYDDPNYFLSLCETDPEVAAELFKICNPTADMINKAYDNVDLSSKIWEYDYDPRPNDRPHFFLERGDEGLRKENFWSKNRKR